MYEREVANSARYLKVIKVGVSKMVCGLVTKLNQKKLEGDSASFKFSFEMSLKI